MPKIVDSMLKVFGRNKENKDRGHSDQGRKKKPTKRTRRSVLDADSFVFLPGDHVSRYWGAILNNEDDDPNFPISQLAADYSDIRRRKTHIGLIHSEESGVQEVNIIRPRAKTHANSSSTEDKDMLRNAKLFNRRLSGTLVKAKKSTDEVEDGSLIQDYAFRMSDRERWSQDLSGRYVYDRLFCPPTKSSTPLRHSQIAQWKYPGDENSQVNGYGTYERLKEPGDSEEKKFTDRSNIRSPPIPRPAVCDVSDNRHSPCDIVVSDEDNRVIQVKRAASRNTLASHGYCDLEPLNRRFGSEYCMPADAIDWDDVKDKTWIETAAYATVHEPESPLFGSRISPRDIFLEEKIGEGQFGDVHKGILYPNTNDEVVVAIKTCKPDASHDDKAQFLEEAAVMCKFSHPHIIKLFGVMVQETHTYIVMELAPLGQLRRYLLTEGSRISKLQLLEYIHQLSSAMVHLENKNYVHRDIAARNLLVTNPRVVKLADFGLSRGLEETDYYVASPGKLPIKWMAPESINFRRFTGLSDVWMFGVCCWEILMRGVKPFVGIKNDEVINRIENGERLPIPPECPAQLFRLMNVCWEYDPQERPRFNEIEGAISVIIEEERELDKMTQRRVFAIQRDEDAPQKPPRGPGISQTPSDSSIKHLSTVSYSSNGKRLSGHIDPRDEPLPLPHQAMSKFRDLSVSPPQPGDPRHTPSNGVTPPPNKPPRTAAHHSPHHPGWSSTEYPPDPRLDHPPPLPIEPYSVTTISAPEDGELHIHSSNSRSSESPLPPSMTGSIPPPSIIRQPRRPLTSSGSDVYYSTPAEIAERGAGRMLNEEGVFVDKESLHTSHSSLDQGLRPRLREGRPVSHVSTNSSSRSSPVFEDGHATRGSDDFKVDDDDSILQQTTAVVKAVMELSNKVPLSRPNDYVELVKNVGLALRDLLLKVDGLIKELPQQTHSEVSMAHKVLSSDMTQLVEAMKNAQKHYQTFLEQDYQKQMLKAAHIVAVNAKQLLDAVNSARRKAQLMQR